MEVAEDGQNRILELSPLSATILQHCKQPIDLLSLRNRLDGEAVPPDLSEAIEILHRQGLIEVIHPVPVLTPVH